MRNILLSTLFLAILQFGHSQSFVVDNEPLGQKKFLDDEQVFIYQDPEGELTFEAIAHPSFQNNFKPRSQFKDYSSTGILWLRFTIKNNTDQRKDLVFYANDWDVQFFTLDKTNVPIFAQPQGVLVKTYNDHLYSGEDADGKIADDIMPYSSKTYYVKTKGILKELAFKDYDFIAVSDRQSADSRALFDLWSIGIYAGVLLLILFGDFYLMVTAYKRSYLFYALYSSCHLFFFTGYYQIPTLFSFQWPFSHSLFLPITAILYLAFIHSYLSLSTVNKLISRLFRIYIFLGSLVILILFYLNLTDMVAYYKLLPLANKVNLFSILVGTLLLIKIPGKLKYFVFLGSVFIIFGATLTWITQYHNAYAQTFFYSFAGNALEKITFLFGIFYLHNREQNASRIKLMNAQKQLELSQQQLTNFSNSIKEKNRLIETFEAQMEQSKDNQTQKQEYIKQLTNSIILTEADWDNFKSIFEEVYPNFFFMLKQDYPQITQAEIRLIAMLKLNLNNKEIGGMLGISPESVIKTKYRLKKKLAESEQGDLASLLEEI
ncbi:7TM-DISM domain-containing protein [Flagellimonas aequoris]|uniref:7TM-DISM receptor extracellular domain-containing protein n=1 Tax=Flagellimonas aequoris TaxID=2306997 RepID=A0A418N799_9FLAO|nr:7TM-DISM domain-containing protein [Allomuricauda aequoris]RIV70768.1 hypothetical protein D2U88_10445 [Allomuricauda aequoris]TXK02207.1 hypothetical protein FQ019_10365 [Allomuricauda aequoris]